MEILLAAIAVSLWAIILYINRDLPEVDYDLINRDL